RWAEEKGDSGCRGGRALSAHRAISRSTRPLAGAWKRSGRAELISTVVGFEVVVLRLPCVAGHRDGLVAKVLNLVDATGLGEKPASRAVVGKLGCRSSDARPKLMPRTADFRVLAGLDLDVLGCPDFGAALAHERKLVAARHALVAVRGGLIAVEVRCRETADQNDGVEHDRFISRVGQPTGQRHWFVVSSCSKVRRR